MNRLYAQLVTATARLAASLLLIVATPVGIFRTAVALCRGGRLGWASFYNDRGQFRALTLIEPNRAERHFWLLSIVCGHMGFIGPEPQRGESAGPIRKPGLASPSRVRDAAGIGHQVGWNIDEVFFANSTFVQRIALLCRYAMSRLLSTPAANIDSHEAVVELFGVRINAVSMTSAVETMIDWSSIASRDDMKIISFVNPDCLNKASENREYHYLLGRADMVLPDGSGLRIAAKLMRLPLHDNVNGTDLFPILCEQAARQGRRLFLFGGLPGVAAKAAETMQARFPELQIAGCLDGYGDLGDRAVNEINASGTDILLLGLGAPLQEQWLHDHQNKLKVAVGVGVGGLFDYYSGRISRAPLWLRESGLEWVWRILQEPGAKWRRYILGNPVFLWKVFAEKQTRGKRIAPNRLQTPLPPLSQLAMPDAGTPRSAVYGAKVTQYLWKLNLGLRHAAKRALDISVSAAAIICLTPLLLVTAAAIRLESPGSILFQQVRVGARGETFSMLKFRSMFVDAEARLATLQQQNESEGGVLFKMKEDPRITRVGKFIRRFSIDELPQILNVLAGDMAIVGPRPALPGEVAQYASSDRKRLQTKPGLTCLWQIGGRSDLSFEQQVDLDIEYLRKQSLVTDFRIIAGTVPAVIAGKGAY